VITGSVSGHHALVRLELRLASGQQVEIDFVLDTGFAGYLTLPPSVISALSLPFLLRMPAYLADGSRIMLAVHEVAVLWDGTERLIEVLATGGEALLGAAMLNGHEVTIQFVDGGGVVIEKL
jgi:clan AA aspartic protease